MIAMARSGMIATLFALAGCASVKDFPSHDELSPARAIDDGAIATLVQGIEVDEEGAGVDAKALRVLSDGDSLYWVSHSGKLSTLSLANGAPEMLVESGVCRLVGVNALGIYFISNHDVYRRSRNGNIENLTNRQTIQSATLRGEVLTWISEIPMPVVESNGTGTASARTVGVFTQDGARNVRQLAELENMATGEIASTATTLFITDALLLSLPNARTAPALMKPLRINAFCDLLLADEEAAYCDLQRVANDGTVSVLSEQMAARIAMDGDSIYFTTRYPKTMLYKVSKKGGAVLPIAEEDVRVVAADTRAIYWITGTGDLKRRQK